MPKFAWFKFDVGRWMKDPELSMCAPATRGIWIDLICAMHESDQSGVIAARADQLARLCRCSVKDFMHAIDDLKLTKAADVTIRNGIVTLICRSMNAEHKSREDVRLRVIKSRKNKASNTDVTDLYRNCNAECNVDVTGENIEERNKRIPPNPPEGDGGDVRADPDQRRRRRSAAERVADRVQEILP